MKMKEKITQKDNHSSGWRGARASVESTAMTSNGSLALHIHRDLAWLSFNPRICIDVYCAHVFGATACIGTMLFLVDAATFALATVAALLQLLSSFSVDMENGPLKCYTYSLSLPLSPSPHLDFPFFLSPNAKRTNIKSALLHTHTHSHRKISSKISSRLVFLLQWSTQVLWRTMRMKMKLSLFSKNNCFKIQMYDIW